MFCFDADERIIGDLRSFVSGPRPKVATAFGMAPVRRYARPRSRFLAPEIYLFDLRRTTREGPRCDSDRVGLLVAKKTSVASRDVDRSEGGEHAAMNFLIGVCTPKLENVYCIG